jgi:hypothetical protein
MPHSEQPRSNCCRKHERSRSTVRGSPPRQQAIALFDMPHPSRWDTITTLRTWRTTEPVTAKFSTTKRCVLLLG